MRERKKLRTRNALARAALELFTRQGFEQTTVDEISEAVEVSQRTFFRYFAGKEDVAFATQQLVETHFLEALLTRPADEPPMAALRGAVAAAWDGLAQAMAEMVPIELHMRAYQMIESTPVLLAVHLRRSAELEERMAREIARREGLDVDADPRPRLAVAAFSGAIRVTGRLWGEGPDHSLDALRTLTMAYLDRIGPALVEHWRKTD
ncbi:TetR family transcriptional regulator [Streptomyces palmae]|uniref:TetR family transcriptional regulator n=1 Tax=Streptomyces palmae TaxID=1701085 RepID=A0A4Z0HEW1_9ACTN|nr:TetR family transcriptional regulator [Streptomyces palmae]TGB13480.1 TetR family transcriptional regulator [Streptomyces palmae]